MLSVSIEVSQKLLNTLRKIPSIFDKTLYNGMIKALYFLESEVKQAFGTPGKPKVKTGMLRRSIGTRVQKTGENEIVGYVGSGSKISVKPVIYARIQDVGGVVKAKGNYLVFKTDSGRWVKKKQVTIPARPYLSPVYENNKNKLASIISQEILKGLQNG